MVNILQKDHEYLQTFLSENISDEDTLQGLNQSQPLQEIASIIKLLKTGDRNESRTYRIQIFKEILIERDISFHSITEDMSSL